MSSLAEEIAARAEDLGFDLVGVAPADYGEHASRFRRWLSRGCHAGMDYLSRSVEKRTRPELVLPGVRSVVCVGMSYGPGRESSRLPSPTRGFISRCARNRDYHEVMKEPLTHLADRLAEVADGRTVTYVDTGPVVERVAAHRAGLGWWGRNTCLVNQRFGSWFFLGEILTTAELSPSGASSPDHCGECRLCLEACPTGALIAPGQLDARRCLSYLTIEHKGVIPRALRPLVGNRVYGCDSCQEVCPWNQHAARTAHPEFLPREDLEAPQLTELLLLPPEAFRERFRGTSLYRLKRKRLARNAAVALGNSGDPSVVPALREALRDPEPLVREHVAWALDHLGFPPKNLSEPSST